MSTRRLLDLVPILSVAGVVAILSIHLVRAEPAPKAPAGAAKAAPKAGATSPSPKAASPEPTAVGANLLVNPGFEHGREPWTTMGGVNWGAFDVVDAPVHSGLHAARLSVHATPEETNKAKVFGAVQEIRRDTMPGDFPDTLSGWYRVNTWNKPKTGMDLYMQAVVIIWGDPRCPHLIGQKDGETPVVNYQIRFYLAGLEKPAFVLSNAHLEFVTRGEPVVGQWVHFDIPVKQKFQEDWGVVPEGYEFIRVLFEARWDNKKTGEIADADVVYDDLFLGYGKPPEK